MYFLDILDAPKSCASQLALLNNILKLVSSRREKQNLSYIFAVLKTPNPMLLIYISCTSTKILEGSSPGTTPKHFPHWTGKLTGKKNLQYYWSIPFLQMPHNLQSLLKTPPLFNLQHI